MKKTSGLVFIFILLLTVIGLANEIIEPVMENKTPENVPLQFHADMFEWDGAGVKITGSVANNSEDTYNTVRVEFVFSNEAGNMLIARKTVNVTPMDIPPGASGEVDAWIECHGSRPEQITYKVSGLKTMR